MSILRGLVGLVVDLLSDLFLYSYVRQEAADLLGLVAIVLLGSLTWYFSRLLRRRQFPILRGISGLFDLDRTIAATAETGKAVHFSVGTGSLGNDLTLHTLAGIDVLKEVSLRSSLAGPPFVSTTSSALALPVMEGAVRHAYAEAGLGASFQAENNRFIAPTPVAYAAGVMRVLDAEDVGLNVMVGSFGDEYLLMAEAGAMRGAKQLVATTNPTVLPFVVATADYPIIGEELFALSSYLRPAPARIGSIIAQDTARLMIVAVILVLVVTYPWLGHWVVDWASVAIRP